MGGHLFMPSPIPGNAIIQWGDIRNMGIIYHAGKIIFGIQLVLYCKTISLQTYLSRNYSKICNDQVVQALNSL